MIESDFSEGIEDLIWRRPAAGGQASPRAPADQIQRIIWSIVVEDLAQEGRDSLVDTSRFVSGARELLRAVFSDAVARPDYMEFEEKVLQQIEQDHKTKRNLLAQHLFPNLRD